MIHYTVYCCTFSDSGFVPKSINYMNIRKRLGRGEAGDFPGGVCLQFGRPGFDPWVRKIPWRRKWQPSPVLLPGKSHGRRSLVGYSPWGRKESGLRDFTFFSLYAQRLGLQASTAGGASGSLVLELRSLLAASSGQKRILKTTLLTKSVALFWSLMTTT